MPEKKNFLEQLGDMVESAEEMAKSPIVQRVIKGASEQLQRESLTENVQPKYKGTLGPEGPKLAENEWQCAFCSSVSTGTSCSGCGHSKT